MTSVFDDPEKQKEDLETKEVIKQYTEAIKAERLAKGFSQMKVMREAGLSQKTVSEIETGGNFRMSNYIKIARALGLVPKIRFVRYKKSVSKT